MGLRLHHVSTVVLVCVGMLLHDNLVLDAAQASEPFVDFLNISPRCFLNSKLGIVTHRPSDRCLYPEKIRFKENATGPVFSFSTKFIAELNLRPPSKSQLGYGGSARNALEGFTFAVLPHPNASLGGDGGYLGLLNAASNGDPESHTFAVEFDFVKSPQFSDPNEGFHIGIDINSMSSNYSVYLEGPSDFSRLWLLQVWIDYDASSQLLNVSTVDISLQDCPVTWIPNNSLSVQVDLSHVLNEHMYVGFTSSIAVPLLQFHEREHIFLDIYPWSLRTSNWPAAPSDPLPCLPPKHTFDFATFKGRLLEFMVSLIVMLATYSLVLLSLGGEA